MAETWTVLKLIQWTSEYFTKKQIDSPRLTAELLLSRVLGLSRVKLYVAFDQPVQKDELAAFRALIERRVAGEPTAYLLGAKEFFGRSFAVDPRVLVPRPETERLVGLVLEQISNETEVRVLDLCTGSGCIAATLAAERPRARLVATDISSGALEVARANVRSLGVQERVELLEGDLFGPLGAREFDMVVSNPPYVAESEFEKLPRDVQQEPRLALLAGAHGLDVITRIAREAPAHLAPDGWLALEIGDEQKSLAQELLSSLRYRDVKVCADWAGKDRVALARRPA